MSRFGARLRGSLPVSMWMRGGASGIDSIQTGTISVASAVGANTATITAVDTTRTILLHLGTSYNISGSIQTGPCVRIALTNATTVTATDVVTADGATATVSFVAVQFKVGVLKSLQRGTVTTAAGTSTLSTAVNTAKSFVNLLGFSTTSNDNNTRPRLALTNSTTVTASASAAGATVSFEVAEFN